MKIEQKRASIHGLNLQWKVVDAVQGIIKGYLSVFNNVDSTNDRVRPGAYKKTIADALQRKDTRGKKYLWPVLWMHDPEKPIGGFIDAIEDKTGLLVTAQLDVTTLPDGTPRNPLAMSVFSGFDLGYIDELSIGYKALQKAYDNAGVRDLTEIQLFEGSAVTMNFAANELAQVSSVKAKNNKMETNKNANEIKDFNDYYRQRQIADWLNRYSSITGALRSAIVDAFNIGDMPDSDVQAALSGFNAAVIDWTNDGIALDVSTYMKQPDIDSLANEQGMSEYDLMGYMARPAKLASKAGATVSQSNADRMKGHVSTLEQVKDMISTVAEDITHYVTGGPAYSDKTTSVKPLQKALNTNDRPLPDNTYMEQEDLEQFAAYLAAIKVGN